MVSYKEVEVSYFRELFGEILRYEVNIVVFTCRNGIITQRMIDTHGCNFSTFNLLNIKLLKLLSR